MSERVRLGQALDDLGLDGSLAAELERRLASRGVALVDRAAVSDNERRAESAEARSRELSHWLQGAILQFGRDGRLRIPRKVAAEVAALTEIGSGVDPQTGDLLLGAR
jgi:hypothetical protein